MDKQPTLSEIADNPDLIEIGRKAIEDMLIEWRDSRMSEFTRGNGLVIREKDGTESSVIRFGPDFAIQIALRAIDKHLTSQKPTA